MSGSFGGSGPGGGVWVQGWNSLIQFLNGMQQSLSSIAQSLKAVVFGLTANNTFTGNNTFDGTSTFNGASTFNGSATFDGASTFNGSVAFDGATSFKPPPTISAGATGTGTFLPMGLPSKLFNGSGSGNGADTTDDTLFSYSLPANSLDTNGQQVTVEASGDFAGNANNKTVKLWFGSQTVISTGVVALNGTGWVLRMTVVRAGAGVQLGYAIGLSGTTFTQAPTTFFGTQDDTSAILIKVTGASPTMGAANDVLGYTMSVAYMN